MNDKEYESRVLSNWRLGIKHTRSVYQRISLGQRPYLDGFGYEEMRKENWQVSQL